MHRCAHSPPMHSQQAPEKARSFAGSDPNQEWIGTNIPKVLAAQDLGTQGVCIGGIEAAAH